MKLKRCHKCKEHLPENEFNFCSVSKDGLQARCKNCFKSYYEEKKASIRRKQNERAKVNYYKNLKESRRLAVQKYQNNADELRLRQLHRYYTKKAKEQQEQEKKDEKC